MGALRGKTEVEPFRNTKDIKDMMDYYKQNELWDDYLLYMFGLLTGRRGGDILSMRWSDIFFPNGRYKEKIDTIVEQKTDKVINLTVTPMIKRSVEFYKEKTGVNPLNDLDDFIFQYPSKTTWKKRETHKNELNRMETKRAIEIWAEKSGKVIDEKRVKKIMKHFSEQKQYKHIGDYLFYEVEYKDIIKSQEEIFRRKMKKAADAVGIEYPVGLHSTRKTLGMIMKLSHPNDPYAMDIIQNIFGHSDVKITAHYIGLSEEQKRRYFNDLSDTIEKIEAGETDVIAKNSPVTTLKNEHIRDIIMYVIDSKESDVERFNHAMQMVDELKQSVL